MKGKVMTESCLALFSVASHKVMTTSLPLLHQPPPAPAPGKNISQNCSCQNIGTDLLTSMVDLWIRLVRYRWNSFNDASTLTCFHIIPTRRKRDPEKLQCLSVPTMCTLKVIKWSRGNVVKMSCSMQCCQHLPKSINKSSQTSLSSLSSLSPLRHLNMLLMAGRTRPGSGARLALRGLLGC